jgi:hypothetical protein
MFDREPQNYNEGYAIVGRFMFEPSTGRHFLERVDLTPGEGVIFKRGRGFKYISEKNLYYELWSSLQKMELASVAYYESDSGDVVIMGVHEEGTHRIASNIPQDKRAQRLVVDSREYAIIIDSCQEAAEERLPNFLNDIGIV